jgi:hypothetical protein
MTVIPHLIARYAIIFYVLAAIGALLYAWSAFQARRRQGVALFSLEREDAVNQGLRSWVMASACVLVAVGVFGISSYVVPNMPDKEAEGTPLISLLFTPTANPALPPTAAPIAIATATFAPAPTVAPIATPLARVPDTPEPVPTGDGEGGVMPAEAACSSAGTQIVSPRNGDFVSGVIEVLGTANLPNFSFYKFEIQWPGNQDWVTLQSFEVPVAGGVLGHWDTAPLAQQPGTYRFRLVVVDDTGNFPDPCVIGVVIE